MPNTVDTIEHLGRRGKRTVATATVELLFDPANWTITYAPATDAKIQVYGVSIGNTDTLNNLYIAVVPKGGKVPVITATDFDHVIGPASDRAFRYRKGAVDIYYWQTSGGNVVVTALEFGI